jgi:hypothetical protein
MDEAMERIASAKFFVHHGKHQPLFIQRPTNDAKPSKFDLHHESALFLNYIIKNWSFDTSKLSTYEVKDYNLAV